MRGKRTIATSILVLGAALVASNVIAGQFRGSDPQRFHDALASDGAVRVAEIAAADGNPARGVFVQETELGQVCWWDAPSATSMQRGGGCNALDDPLGGSVLSASLAYDGGPAITTVRDARLIGLVDPDVASVVVVMSDGSERRVRLTKANLNVGSFQAFGYRVEKADLRRGIGPVAVVARDGRGARLARQPTGIGD